jgi:EAL domain-containing protein (putative c-di-GMP-specific phosphodiesterase class I)
LGNFSYQATEEIMRDADAAMYEAKAKNKGYDFFKPEIRERILSCLLLENDLEWAIDRGEFQLRYQPLVYLKTNEIYGFEVLLRWFHPQRGTISPGHFIPIAEQSKVIKKLDAWVLRESCRQLRQWQTKFKTADHLIISVNLSPVELLEPKFVKQIESTLKEEGISPHCIRLELTETAFLDETCLDVFEQLQALGIQLSIDDFGTGESSLSRLHQLPLSTIKVDRAFVQQLNQGHSSEAIVQTILTLAHSLGVNTVSEGIETAQQRDRLLSFGCLLGQGYFYSAPIEANLATEMLEAGNLINFMEN